MSADFDLESFIDRAARALGITNNNRRQWRNRGVPHRWRLELIELARAEGVDLRNADFERRQEDAA